MSTPAQLTFRRDRRFKLAAIRVYDYLLGRLDHVEVRAVKLWELTDPDLPESPAVDKEAAIAGLDQLVGCGYLVEHPRGERGVRRFTLAFSVATSRLLPTDTAA